jgi:flagellar export protein FliJ
MTRRFPLQTVERLRATQLDGAARRLAAARAAVTRAEAGLDQLRAELAACVPPASSTPDQLGIVAARRELLLEQAERAAAELDELRSGAATAVTGWATARAGLRAVESLHDRHRIGEAEAELRREQLLGDELAGVLAAFPRPGATPTPGPGGDAA